MFHIICVGMGSLRTICRRGLFIPLKNISNYKANHWWRPRHNSASSGITSSKVSKQVSKHISLFQTIGFDPMVSAEAAAAFNVEKRELAQIWPDADYITIHTPLIPQTRSEYLSVFLPQLLCAPMFYFLFNISFKFKISPPTSVHMLWHNQQI
jgi:hypothetical protein